MPPLKIQLAIQGGGAKICALIAAAEALQDLEEQQKIEITRLSGTSAGAIVACFLASRRDRIETVRQRLLDLGEAEIRRMFPSHSKLRMVSRILRGRPVYDEGRLREFLGKFFGDRKIGDLDLPVFITASDLLEGQKRSFDENDTRRVIDRLVDSCALPYVFRAWKTIGQYPLVDGGLCENLPSDELIEGASRYGEVVAISFRSHGVPQAPDGLVEFSMALIETAINNSMERAKRSLKKGSIIHLDTHISTFDIGHKLTDALDPTGDHYRRIKLEVEKWFEKTFLVQQDSQRQTVIFGDPWATGESTPEGLGTMTDLTEVYLRQHHDAVFDIRRSAMVITAYSLLDQEGGDPRREMPDIVRQVVDLQPTVQPIYCYRLRLGAHPNAEFEDRASWTVRDARGEPVSTRAFPMAEASAEGAPLADTPTARGAGAEPRAPGERDGGSGDDSEPGGGADADKGEDEYSREVLLFFLPPLTADDRSRCPFSVTQQTLITGAMAPLRAGDDGLVNSNTRPRGSIDQVDFVLHLPDDFPTVRAHLMDGSFDGAESPKPMSDRQLTHYGEPPPGFIPVGWTTSSVPPGCSYGIHLRVDGRVPGS